MRRQTHKYELEFDKTISYFIEHIQCEKTLSQTIVKEIDFRQGVFFTILPSELTIEKLYEFSYGGIISPIPYGKQEYKIEGVTDNFHPEQIVTMDYECSEFIATFAKQGKNCAVVENYMFTPDSAYAQIENVKMSCYEKEVYYFLNNKNSVEEIYKTIRKSKEVWHSLFVLTQLEFDNLDLEIFDLISNNAKFVIAGAYDGEGYIFWERNIQK